MSEWHDDIFDCLHEAGVRQVAYVPDAGHARLINRCQEANNMRALSLTTEEDGIALLAGAWLGGDKGVLLMQSSGVGNTINMLSLVKTCQFPLVTLVTMRGEWGEWNTWQVPMGQTTQQGGDGKQQHMSGGFPIALWATIQVQTQCNSQRENSVIQRDEHVIQSLLCFSCGKCLMFGAGSACQNGTHRAHCPRVV